MFDCYSFIALLFRYKQRKNFAKTIVKLPYLGALAEKINTKNYKNCFDIINGKSS